MAIGLGGVGATWWLGRRAYGTGAAIVGAAAVAVATTHVAYSRMAVTDVLLTLAVTCVLALAVEGRIEWAGLAVGLAASAKYPGRDRGRSGRRRGVGEVAGARPRRRRSRLPGSRSRARSSSSTRGRAWDDISRVQRLARGGLARVRERPDRTARLPRPALGRASARCCSSRPSGSSRRSLRRTRADLILLSFALAYWLTLMPQQAHFERYILPLVPVLAVLAGSVRVGGAVRARRARAPARLERLRRARAHAHRHAPAGRRVGGGQRPRGDRIAADPSTLPLDRPAGWCGSSCPGPGRPSDPERDLARLRREGVKWVIVSGAVTDRVLAAPDRYPREAAFYEQLGHGRTARLRRLPGGAGAGRALGAGLPALIATVAR